MGTNSKAATLNTVAIGNTATATSMGGVAIGNTSTASSANATAVGTNTIAKGASSVAIGNNATATTTGGVAIGSGSVADTWYGLKSYDPSTKTISTDTSATWMSTASAVSVGDADEGITRQITGVAAGKIPTRSTWLSSRPLPLLLPQKWTPRDRTSRLTPRVSRSRLIPPLRLPRAPTR